MGDLDVLKPVLTIRSEAKPSTTYIADFDVLGSDTTRPVIGGQPDRTNGSTALWGSDPRMVGEREISQEGGRKLPGLVIGWRLAGARRHRRSTGMEVAAVRDALKPSMVEIRDVNGLNSGRIFKNSNPNLTIKSEPEFESDEF